MALKRCAANALPTRSRAPAAYSTDASHLPDRSTIAQGLPGRPADDVEAGHPLARDRVPRHTERKESGRSRTAGPLEPEAVVMETKPAHENACLEALDTRRHGINRRFVPRIGIRARHAYELNAAQVDRTVSVLPPVVDRSPPRQRDIWRLYDPQQLAAERRYESSTGMVHKVLRVGAPVNWPTSSEESNPFAAGMRPRTPERRLAHPRLAANE